MSGLGLALLLLVAVLGPVTGVPGFVVLLFSATLGAVIGVVSGAVPPELLSALPARLVSLAENDLLQALPLYVLVGTLINRLPIADALFAVGVRVFPRRVAPGMATLALGALLAPMNGSIGASVLALGRTAAPRLAASGMQAPPRHALLAAASTLGIVVPPSLVLILLGDAMMAAHTVAVNSAHRSEQIINTQDLFRGALLPAALFLAGCVAVVALRARGTATPPIEARQRPLRGEAMLALACVAFVVVLLAGVATGRFYAVEGAAAGAAVMFTACALTGRLRGGALSEVLGETLALTGALVALLVAATTFTLVFRALGTDRLLETWIDGASLGPTALTATVLAVIGAAALALDAFEIIFVLVPVLIPPLLVRVPDATWVAVLVLLALQASFMLPPVGYALLMLRSALRERVPSGAQLRSLAPFLLVQAFVLGAVLAFPALVHLGSRGVATDRVQTPLPEDEVSRRMQEMLAPPSEGEATAP